jgi:hypothetical protein
MSTRKLRCPRTFDDTALTRRGCCAGLPPPSTPPTPLPVAVPSLQRASAAASHFATVTWRKVMAGWQAYTRECTTHHRPSVRCVLEGRVTGLCG